MERAWTALEGSAWWALLRSNTLLLRGLGSDIQADGLAFEWFDVLVNVYQYPADEMPLASLVDNVVLSRSGLTRLLDRMEAAGHLAGGQKLKDGEGRVMKTEKGKLRVLDGPYSETKEVIGGYWLIDAADYDEAIELSRDCPHIEYGASLEIREVEQG